MAVVDLNLSSKYSTKAHICCIMPPHVFLCAYYNNKAFKNAKNKETKWHVITETEKNKLNQMNKAHIVGLSSYICCMLIYLKGNDKSIYVYTPLVEFKWHDKEVAHICDALTHVILVCKIWRKWKKANVHEFLSSYIYCVQFNERR